jgi:hypothetical protein
LPSASLNTGCSIIRTAVPTPTSDFRSRNRKFWHDDALENDLATPAREITSRHGVDKGSLLPVAARRDAVARNATSRMAREADVFTLQRLPSHVQSLNRQSNPRGLHNWCRKIRAVCDWDLGSLEVDTLFVSGTPLSPLRARFTNFLIGSFDADFVEHSYRLWI